MLLNWGFYQVISSGEFPHGNWMQLVYVHPSLLGFKLLHLGSSWVQWKKLPYLKQDSWRDLTQTANFIFSTKHEPSNSEFSFNFKPVELALITNCTVNHPLIARGFHHLTSNISFIWMGSYNLSFGSTPPPSNFITFLSITFFSRESP